MKPAANRKPKKAPGNLKKSEQGQGLRSADNLSVVHADWPTTIETIWPIRNIAMKNATVYEKKVKKLLGKLPKRAALSVPTDDPLAVIVMAVLQADTTRDSAKAVFDEIQKEFVDFNDLRVAPVKDISDCMDRDFPLSRQKADSIARSLDTIFDKTGSFSMEHLHKMPKRELRKYLQDIGLDHYAAALVLMTIFGGHAIPVDENLVYVLKAEDYLPADATIDEVQGFLERIIPQKEGPAAHEFFRDYVEKNAKLVAQKHKEDAARQAAAPAPVKPPRQAPAQLALAADVDLAADMGDGKEEPEPPAPTAKPAKRGRPVKPSEAKKPSRPARGRRK